MKKKAFVALLAFFALLVAAAIGAVTYPWWSLPTVSGTLHLPGLSQDVRVVRDNWGIPHLYARNELDAFRALGYTAAQDRLFQMDLHRRLANGQLSEIFGDVAIKADQLARTFGFRHYAEKLLAANSLRPDFLRAAEAYRDGLNSYISTQELPIEFKLLGYKPRPFEVVEMLAFAGYMAYGFSEAFRGDILFANLLEEIPASKIDELRGGIENSAPTTANPVSITIDSKLFAALHDDPLLQLAGSFNGSNSWVVSPARSKSGHAILANDPHISFSKPAIWYEAHLVSPTFEVYGHFLSFIPFPVLGHTREIAWAITMSEVDDMDFYREKANPQNPGEIYVNGRWQKLEERIEKIAVKGRPDIELRVQTGTHGPLVQHLLNSEPKDLISLKWQYHDPDNLGIEAFFDLAHAKSVDDFSAALKKAKTPGLNMSYADKAGNIAWWVMGQIPIRPAQTRPDSVLDGASGADEYLGYVPFEQNPHAVNPDNGMIITANNKPSNNTTYPLFGYFQPSERTVQLHRLLDHQERWSAEEFKSVQMNQYEVFYSEQVPLLLSLLQPPFDVMDAEAYGVLKNWDGQSGASSIGATVYNEWRSQILRKTLLDELGDERFKVFCGLAEAWHFYKRLIANPASQWWDDVTTKDHVETREEIVTKAFREALAVLTKRLGDDVDKWTWGRLHTLEYVHVLGLQKPLNLIFNAGPYPAGGNYSQVNAMASARGEEDFPVIAGPSTRRIVDFNQLDKSWGISPLGNSGNLLSRHERDQIRLFLDGQYRFQLMNETDIQRSTETVMILTPQ